MRKTLVLAGFGLLLTLTPSRAQEECDRDDDSQSMLNICADVDYQASDAKLNEAYKKLLESMGGDKHSENLLKTAQRAWIAFRDAECAFAASDSEGGSIYPMLVSGCLQQLTEERTKQLEDHSSCEEGDMSCAGSDDSDDSGDSDN